jgi:signal transduction histidine kinase
MGIVGIRERVRALGGTFAIESAPGAGTTLRATLPLNPRAELTLRRAAAG